MQFQLLFRPGCVECLRVKLLIGRIRPEYPDLEVEEIDLAAQPHLVTKYCLGRRPGIVVDGRLVARKHLLEVDLRRATPRRRRRPSP